MTEKRFEEIMENSKKKKRKYFELCYFHGMDNLFMGEIQKVNIKDRKIVFQKIYVEGQYQNGSFFFGLENHVWIDFAGFENLSCGDCVQFSADVYRYFKPNEQRIDYALENPKNIKKIEKYDIPTRGDLIDQQIDQLVCETCKFEKHCYSKWNGSPCLANEEDVKHRKQILKSFQEGKFTPYTVLLAYELEYRMFMQDGMMIPKDEDENFDADLMKKFIQICLDEPYYYVGNPEEALVRMLYPEYPRVYIE